MRTRIICWLALLGPLAWLFGAVLAERRVCNFRDIAHYYRPLWQWTSAEWATGSVPLWNPFDGLGLPIHADPTASLFYPGQLLFALPVDFTTRLNLYLTGHLLLAAATLYYAARHWGASPVGAAAGAVSYAYGGQVLFQYCNPIFLVSAAWLPLGLLAAQRMLELRSYRWGAVLATTLALMVLGGDPQMAYHVLLLAAFYAWLLWRSEPKTGFVWRSSRGVLFGAVGLGAGLLSAIQFLPTAEWSARSERAAFDAPRNIWEAGQYLVQVKSGAREVTTSSAQAITSGLFAAPAENTHHEQAYEFSVGPWRWLEFVWPNIGGRMFPTHRRWMSAIPAESRIWTPSIYIGLAPFLVALGCFSLRRSADLTTRWLSWMVVIGLLGGLGVYGIGWLLHELHLARGVGPAVGGLYWFFVVLLPGYVQFRYPAKLLVFAAVGLSLLAARGWDAALLQPSERARRGWMVVLAVIVGLSLFGLWLAYSEVWRDWGPIRGEYPFGPLDRAGAAADVFYSCLQTCVLSLVIGGLLVTPRWRIAVPILLLLVTAMELSIAHGWMITSSPAGSAPELVALPTESYWERRFYGGSNREFPSEQAQTNSASRLDELLRWEIAHPQGKWHLANALNRVDAESSLEPRDIAALWRALATHRPERATANNLPLLALGTAWNLSEAQPELQTLPEFGTDGTEFSSRVYLPETVTRLPELTAHSPELELKRTREVFFPHDRPYDARRLATVETNDPEELTAGRGKILSLTRRTYEDAEIHVALETPGLLVLADYFAPGWIAEIEEVATGKRSPATIHRTNRVLRGVMVPAGEQRVLFYYRPWSFYLGAAVSTIAWLLLIALSLRAGYHRLALSVTNPKRERGIFFRARTLNR